MKLKICFPARLLPSGKDKHAIFFPVLLTLFLLTSGTYSGAQAKLGPGVEIGQKVPDVAISNLINFPTGHAKISDFRGKLLILDFWATYCSSCIVNMPKMEELQLEFNNNIEILAVTNEKEATIQSFFNTKTDPEGKKYHFPCVMNDILLNRLFPHQLIPHYVWIGPDGTVIAITSAEEVNRANIKKEIDKTTRGLEFKKDLDPDKPLFISDYFPADNSLLNYCFFSKGNYGGLGSGTRIRKTGKTVYGRAVTNSPLLLIYETAARPLFSRSNDFYNQKRLLLEVKDQRSITLNKSADNADTYQTGNFYNFDLIVPSKKADSLYDYMLKALNTYSDYLGTIEKRKVKCLILSKTNSADKIKSKGGRPENTLFYGGPAILNNLPIANLVARLNAEDSLAIPVIDETNYSGNVDMSFSGATDLNTLRKELNGYGLDLSAAERTINMFIIRDK